MKKTILLLLFASLAFAACKKDDSNASVPLAITLTETLLVTGSPLYDYVDRYTIASDSQVTGSFSAGTVSTGTANFYSAGDTYKSKTKEYVYRVYRKGTNITGYHLVIKNDAQKVEVDHKVTY